MEEVTVFCVESVPYLYPPTHKRLKRLFRITLQFPRLAKVYIGDSILFDGPSSLVPVFGVKLAGSDAMELVRTDLRFDEVTTLESKLRLGISNVKAGTMNGRTR